ncbi:MAG: Stk1 family PASTA domain-containing Ser/Thr kinase, partial [Firmicutes bacterium]|nr:Stk1 family PASTA domain-containing Ser/Thr kinase [Bacillota bacterium]
MMFLQNDTVISGRYRIIEQIGIGGMAVVYKALDIKLDRAVTLKVLKEAFIADEEFLKRFSVEAKAAAKLNHPNIVSAYDVGEDGNIHYIVMEYIDGYTLKELIKKKAPFSNEEALGVAIQIATGLEAAHSCGIIHRDIKPQNILVTKEGSIKVTDFGIARTAGSNTITADSIGSVHYFSPEQARSGFVDYKSDIYSLGIILFEMVTGVVPFEGESAVELAMKHIEEPLPDMKALNPNISDSVVKIILKATEKKASQRYQSAYEMNDNLKRALTNATGDFVRRENKPDLSQTVRVGEEELAAIRQMTGGKPIEDSPEKDESESYDPVDTKDEKYSDDMEEEDIDEEEDEREAKKKERGAAIAAIIAALIVIAAITAVGIHFLNERNDGDYSEVPQL